LNKFFNFVKKHFLTKKFLTFGLVGVANTAIDTIVYYTMYSLLDTGPFWAKTVAFTTASVFSYFANVIFTFKPKKTSTVQFSIVFLVFGARWLISASLAWLFDKAFLGILNADVYPHHYMVIIPSILASALLIPIAYFALDWVFKKTDVKKEDILL